MVSRLLTWALHGHENQSWSSCTWASSLGEKVSCGAPVNPEFLHLGVRSKNLTFYPEYLRCFQQEGQYLFYILPKTVVLLHIFTNSIFCFKFDINLIKLETCRKKSWSIKIRKIQLNNKPSYPFWRIRCLNQPWTNPALELTLQWLYHNCLPGWQPPWPSPQGQPQTDSRKAHIVQAPVAPFGR